MSYRIHVLDPSVAYLGNWLFLPKSSIAPHTLRSALTLPIDQTRYMECYEEHPYHLAVPRHLMEEAEVRENVPLVDLRPSFPSVSLESNIVLDAVIPEKTVQRDSVLSMCRASGGILNLSCGTGKTVIAIEAIVRMGQPALIVAPLDMVMDQWREEITKNVRIENGIGIIQGPPETWDWKNKPISIASLATLSRHYRAVTRDMRRYFGTIIWDECHCVAAPQFSRTASLFPGRRFGLTATVERADRLESVFLWHLGPVIHCDLSQDLIPHVTLLPSPTEVDVQSHQVWPNVSDKAGCLSHTRLMNYLALIPEEMDFLEFHLRDALRQGRRVLAISWCKEQLNQLHARIPESGLITGDVKGATVRREALSNHQLCLGIAHLARQALNEKQLDTLFILTEYRNEGMLQQSVGRIQRFLLGKKTPEVVIVHHERVPYIRGRARHMVKYFERQGFRVDRVRHRSW